MEDSPSLKTQISDSIASINNSLSILKSHPLDITREELNKFVQNSRDFVENERNKCGKYLAVYKEELTQSLGESRKREIAEFNNRIQNLNNQLKDANSALFECRTSQRPTKDPRDKENIKILTKEIKRLGEESRLLQKISNHSDTLKTPSKVSSQWFSTKTTEDLMKGKTKRKTLDEKPVTIEEQKRKTETVPISGSEHIKMRHSYLSPYTFFFNSYNDRYYRLKREINQKDVFTRTPRGSISINGNYMTPMSKKMVSNLPRRVIQDIHQSKPAFGSEPTGTQLFRMYDLLKGDKLGEKDKLFGGRISEKFNKLLPSKRKEGTSNIDQTTGDILKGFEQITKQAAWESINKTDLEDMLTQLIELGKNLDVTTKTYHKEPADTISDDSKQLSKMEGTLEQIMKVLADTSSNTGNEEVINSFGSTNREIRFSKLTRSKKFQQRIKFILHNVKKAIEQNKKIARKLKVKKTVKSKVKKTVKSKVKKTVKSKVKKTVKPKVKKT